MKNTHLPIEIKEIEAGYLHSPYFKDLYQYLLQNKLPHSKPAIKKLEALSERLLLFKINPEKETAVLAIPEECVDKIITLYHKSLFVGHQGVIKTYLTISDKFFIPSAYNTFNSPNLGNYSPYELTFGRKPKLLLNAQANLDIKVSRNFKEYYDLLNKRIKYLQDILFNFKSQRWQ